MSFEKIPDQITVKEYVEKAPGAGGEVKDVKLDLRKADLPMEATFQSMYGQHRLLLVPAQSREDPMTGNTIKVPDTEVRIMFKGYKFHTSNSNLMKMIMNCGEYKSGTITIDPEDGSGLWRALEFIKVKTVQVVDEVQTEHPDWDDDIDITTLKGLTKPEKPVEPLKKE